MVMKVFSAAMLILLAHVGQGGLVYAETTSLQPDAQRQVTTASRKAKQAISSWLHVVSDLLEQQLTHTFWAWWQEDPTQGTSPGAEPALAKLARLQETQTILHWLQNHLDHLETAQLQTLEAWAQAGRVRLDEQQFQTLRTWWLERTKTAAGPDLEPPLTRIVRGESKQPSLTDSPTHGAPDLTAD
ncbi:MAG: hypothetical protein OEU26_34140, partial [Candidatus Tectomicrobia bacterium]|nr:hypothetical protein [Candidatus Tectomicrobia bacterium]